MESSLGDFSTCYAAMMEKLGWNMAVNLCTQRYPQSASIALMGLIGLIVAVYYSGGQIRRSMQACTYSSSSKTDARVDLSQSAVTGSPGLMSCPESCSITSMFGAATELVSLLPIIRLMLEVLSLEAQHDSLSLRKAATQAEMQVKAQND